MQRAQKKTKELSLTPPEIVQLVQGELVLPRQTKQLNHTAAEELDHFCSDPSSSGEGSEHVRITGVASLREAEAGDISFYALPRYLTELRQTKATVVLVPKDFKEEVFAVSETNNQQPILIRVEHPSTAFDRIIAAFAPPEIKPLPGIHPQAYVSPQAFIGENVSIGPFSVIEEGAIIGKGTVIGPQCTIGAHSRVGEECFLHPNAILRERCWLGDRVILQPGVIIGSCGFGYETKQGVHYKIPQAGIVQIDDDVEVGANTTIDRARFGRTHIGKGTKIDNLVQIAHNVIIGPHSIICAQVGISGSTRIGSHVTLAGQVGVSGHLEIGDCVILGAQSGLSKNVKSGAVLIGSPAKPLQTWKENNFYLHNLSKLFQRVKKLEEKDKE